MHGCQTQKSCLPSAPSPPTLVVVVNSATGGKSLPLQYEQELKFEVHRDQRQRAKKDVSDNYKDMTKNFAALTLTIPSASSTLGVKSRISTVSWPLALSPIQLSLQEARQAGEDISGF